MTAHESHQLADTLTAISTGIRTRKNRLLQRLAHAGPKTLSRARMVVFAGYIAAVVTVSPAAAQFQEIGESLCETGFGEIILAGISLFTIILLFKFVFKVMSALDKYNSPKGHEHEEGVEQLQSSVTTFLAAVFPAAFAAMLDIMGLNTFSCLELDIGIFS